MGKFYLHKLGFVLPSTLSIVFPKEPAGKVGCSAHPPVAALVMYLPYDVWNAKAVQGVSFLLLVLAFFIFPSCVLK